MNQTEIKKIKVRDRNGDLNNWIVYGETENTYKVYAECDVSYITELYKSKVGKLWEWDVLSIEIKNPFSLMPKNYMKAEFCEIWARDGEC